MIKATSSTVPLIPGSLLPGSGHLEGDALDDVEHVLAAVGDGLHRLVQLLPLDDLDGVRSPLEEGGQLVPQETVRLVLEAVDLDGVLLIVRRQGAQAPD